MKEQAGIDLFENRVGISKEEGAENGTSYEELNIPEFDLEDGVGELVNLVKEKMSEEKGTIVVEIAGGSASGKTSAVAEKLRKTLGEDAFIFSMDNYYRGGQYIKEEAEKGNVLNLDQPEALNLELLIQHLQLLKEEKSIPELKYAFGDEPPKIVGELQPRKVIILEGLFSLDDSLKDLGDVKVFVDIGTHGRILRRILRDVNRTGQKPADILKYFSEVVEPMHEKYINSTKKNADMIIKNEYNPEIEASRSGMGEIQVKFKANINKDSLRRIDAEMLASTVQIDRYYNPRDRDLSKTGESLRIREEGSYRTLTYKGPKKSDSKFRERPKIEFEIDEETKNSFLSIYGENFKTITKNRTIFQWRGVNIKLDKVSKEDKDGIVDLGEFVEISSTSKMDESDFESLMKHLGLSSEESIKKSYVEM